MQKMNSPLRLLLLGGAAFGALFVGWNFLGTPSEQAPDNFPIDVSVASHVPATESSEPTLVAAAPESNEPGDRQVTMLPVEEKLLHREEATVGKEYQSAGSSPTVTAEANLPALPAGDFEAAGSDKPQWSRFSPFGSFHGGGGFGGGGSGGFHGGSTGGGAGANSGGSSANNGPSDGITLVTEGDGTHLQLFDPTPSPTPIGPGLDLGLPGTTSSPFVGFVPPVSTGDLAGAGNSDEGGGSPVGNPEKYGPNNFTDPITGQVIGAITTPVAGSGSDQGSQDLNSLLPRDPPSVPDNTSVLGLTALSVLLLIGWRRRI
jgi:hypothetical protein